MNIDNLEDKKIKELIEEKTEKLDELYFEVKSGNLGELNEYRKLKKEMARLKTILRERELKIRKIVKPSKKKKVAKSDKKTTKKKITKKE